MPDLPIAFRKESDFETALVELLKYKGWPEVLYNPSEKKLRENFAKIVFQNNNSDTRLNSVPLDEDEVDQIIEQFNKKPPYTINGIINGGSVSLKRTNTEDKRNYGRSVELEIFFPTQVGNGKNIYQVARQPEFKAEEREQRDRRGDVMLLINGLPVIHIELKASGHDIDEGIEQIETYLKLGKFSGIYSTVQIFVSMTPEHSVYFANPGSDVKSINRKYCFEWADFNNEPASDWKAMAEDFLSIPMAHQMVVYYTIADSEKEILKVMRSYQFWASSAIRSQAAELRSAKSNKDLQLGGYIWHTTGSGKTMTSFKSAQLIADANLADKVLFVLDRVELGEQSRDAYNSFYGDTGKKICFTNNTRELGIALKSTASDTNLIVTSIQKLGIFVSEENETANQPILDKLANKKIVFIVDECHRTVFGEIFPQIKKKFPSGTFFGFTGTPIKEENQKNDVTTSSLFGNELHRYSLSDGIRDGNVLPFDCTMVKTIDDNELREKVAMRELCISDISELNNNPDLLAEYNDFLNPEEWSITEIERKLIKEDYSEGHRIQVVSDIFRQFDRLSQRRKFHALLATSSIEDAIAYYRLIKQKSDTENFELRTTAVFDPNLNFETKGNAEKSQAIEEILSDYNQMFGTNFAGFQWDDFKDDVLNRLAHRKESSFIRMTPTSEDRLDLVVVVDQLLTGYDSLWLNTLYIDKKLEYQNLIQAFSRTNRILDDDKIFGLIRYYRYPHTMKQNIENAVELYSGKDAFDFFVVKLPKQIEKLDYIFKEIKAVFEDAGIQDFAALPAGYAEQNQFSRLFNTLTTTLKAAKSQGFDWDAEQLSYYDEETDSRIPIKSPDITEDDYQTLLLRYGELSTSGPSITKPPLLVDFLVNPQSSELINKEYLNSRFTKFLLDINQKNLTEEERDALCNNFHTNFSKLPVSDQVYAEIILSQIKDGSLQVSPEDSFTDLINELKITKEEKRILVFAKTFGLDLGRLKERVNHYSPNENINKDSLFEQLAETADIEKTKAFFDKETGMTLQDFEVPFLLRERLEAFIKGEPEADVPSDETDN